VLLEGDLEFASICLEACEERGETLMLGELEDAISVNREISGG
jgi:hypothetical protein